MRESLSHLLYNDIPIFIFYEKASQFTRYDIIHRVLNSLKEFYGNFISIYIIEYNEGIEAIICKYINCFKLLTNDTCFLSNALHIIFNYCYELLVLEEEGLYDLAELCSKKCFLLGLHKTSALRTVAELFSNSTKSISLGQNSYLTSQCIKIIGYIHTVLCREDHY